MNRMGVLIAALLVGGCATSYQPKSFSGGFSEIRLNEDTYQISVQGNGYTSTERARNIALLRAAELTLQAGGTRFVVIDGQVAQQFAGTTPIQANRIGNSVFVSGGDAIRKPEGTYTVRIVRTNDPAYATALDAKLIDAQLRPQLTQ